MAYALNRFSSPASAIVIPDGSQNTTFDIIIIGKGFTNYGEIIQENLLHILENFSRSTAPPRPTSGQLWFNSATAELSVRTAAGVWKNLDDVVAGAVADAQIAAGAAISLSKLASGTSADIIVANGSGVPTYVGMTGDITISNTGVTALAANSVGTAEIRNGTVQSEDLSASINITTLSWDNATGDTLTVSSLTVTGSATINNLSVSTLVTTGTSEATYADFAERYEADVAVESGDVMIFGGDNEVTFGDKLADTRVAGVISEKAAFILNSKDSTRDWACLALQGRVPCKVMGRVRKGDLLITAEVPRHARAVSGAKAGTIIGKALGINSKLEASVIEVAVGRF